MSNSKIIAVYEHPPIPVRHFDWCAFRDGTDEQGPCGWRATREHAIECLKELETEHEVLLTGRLDGEKVDIDAGRC